VIEQHTAVVAGTSVFWQQAPARTAAPVVYLHGVPTHSDDWLPFLERTGGVALDLPGFGRSGKAANFPYGIEGYAGFLDAWLSQIGIDHCQLVMHDWGAVGLRFAQLAPERIDRLVVANAVPLLRGYHWHRIARLWRTPLVGEVAMGLTFKRYLAKELARASAGEPPPEWIDGVWQHFDHGTQRAILKLYRSAPPDVLARSGARLNAIEAPALVVWGDPDPYLPTELAQRYADALGGEARVEVVAGARHWPWIGRPQTVDLIANFLLER
jgi:pimeloyl-ACP methyl ester carboxylesterase